MDLISSFWVQRRKRPSLSAHRQIRLLVEELEDRMLLNNTLSVGGGQPLNINQPSLALNYIIAVSGVFPSRGGGTAAEGTIRRRSAAIFAGNFAPSGWDLCDGQLLPISQYTALFSVIGTYYGGNGTSNFALPDLQGRAAVEAGTAAGLANVAIGQTYRRGKHHIELEPGTLPRRPSFEQWLDRRYRRRSIRQHSEPVAGPQLYHRGIGHLPIAGGGRLLHR